jgi:hypothetical protein
MTWRQKQHLYEEAAYRLQPGFGMCTAVLMAMKAMKNLRDVPYCGFDVDYPLLMRRKWILDDDLFLKTIPSYKTREGTWERLRILRKMAFLCMKKAEKGK